MTLLYNNLHINLHINFFLLKIDKLKLKIFKVSKVQLFFSLLILLFLNKKLPLQEL